MSGRSNVFSLVDDPAFVRRTLATFLAMRASALDLRFEQRQTATPAERIAMFDVLERIDRWIYDARSWLAARGLPCNERTAPLTAVQRPRDEDGGPQGTSRGAGAEPLRSKGMDALPLNLAVGPAPRHSTSGLHNLPADRFFLNQSTKELQGSENQVNNRSGTAGENLR